MLSILSWQMNQGFDTKISNESIPRRNCSDIPIPEPIYFFDEWTQCPESNYMIDHGLTQCYQAGLQHWIEGNISLLITSY